jgi:V/A-type H+/Na+-transporting ATPase subunit G/H
MMAFEVVKQISEIEREGEQLIKDAQLQASETVKEARNQADAIVQQAKKDADAYYNNVISKYELESREASKPILEDSQVLRENLKKLSSETLDKAINMVIERIVNSHGNS